MIAAYFARGLTWQHKVLDGWQISGITSAQSGTPITPLITGNRAGIGAGGQRPNVSGLVRKVGSKLQWFDTTVFSLPVLGTFGNAGRALVRAPGIFNSDLSFSKATALVVSARDPRITQLRLRLVF